MVSPVNFCFNEETKINNSFQEKQENINTQEKALIEFNNFVSKLKEHNINVISIKDTPIPFTPDSIFPNNWFSTHNDGTLVLYPMFAQNRRSERKIEFIDLIKKNSRNYAK